MQTEWNLRKGYNAKGNKSIDSNNSIDNNKILHLDNSSDTNHMILGDGEDMVNREDAKMEQINANN